MDESGGMRIWGPRGRGHWDPLCRAITVEKAFFLQSPIARNLTIFNDPIPNAIYQNIFLSKNCPPPPPTPPPRGRRGKSVLITNTLFPRTAMKPFIIGIPHLLYRDGTVGREERVDPFLRPSLSRKIFFCSLPLYMISQSSPTQSQIRFPKTFFFEKEYPPSHTSSTGTERLAEGSRGSSPGWQRRSAKIDGTPVSALARPQGTVEANPNPDAHRTRNMPPSESRAAFKTWA